MARKLGLPLVATNDIHFARRDDAESQDVLVCIQTNRKISDPDRLKFSTDQFYFKTAAEMTELFKDTPDAIENTGKIAARCTFEFPSKTYYLPNFVPPEGKDLGDYFEEMAWRGFRARMARRQADVVNGSASHSLGEYEERLEREIKLIKEMHFEGYFLIVWDLLKAAREKGIPVGPGRGSAAGSLLAYALEITEIDPIEYDLLFERFLNPERISLPDIDMDFCGRRRQEMIEYVTQKYGQENVCQIITFGTMAARGAIRDVGRVLEVPLPEVDRIAKMIPFAVGRDHRRRPQVGPRAQGPPRPELQDRPAPGHRPEDRGPGPPPLDPRRRHRHHAQAAGRVPAPLPVGQGRGHDPVPDGRRRGHRPAQDGPPGPAQPDGHRRRPGAHQGRDRRSSSISTTCPLDDAADLRALPGPGTRTASSSSRARA